MIYMRKKRKVVIIITIILLMLFLLFVCSFVLDIKNYRAELRAQYKQSVEIFLAEKYQEEMIVHDDVMLHDMRLVSAHLKSNPSINFWVWGGGKGIRDEYLQECLRYDAHQKFTTILQQYFPDEFSLQVGGIVWENPDPSGELETNYYLYELYRSLGRPPTWEEVGSNVRLEKIRISIEGVIDSDEQRADLHQRFKESGCHAEKIELTDENGITKDFSFPF